MTGSTTAGVSSPSILRMAAPLVVSFWMRAAFTLVDTIYAATVGDAAVAAIGLTVPFEYLLIALWVGLSTGLTSALSRAMGAREGGKIAQYLRAGWVLVLTHAPIFAVIGAGIWFVAPRVGLEEDVGRAFAIYGSVLIGGSAFTAFWSVIPDSVVKAHQDTRSTMWAGIWSNVINVTLNTIFVFVFHWGIFGIALSTVIGRIGGLVYALARARHHEDRRKAAGDFDRTREDPRPYWTILSLAVPSSLSFVLMAGETGIVNLLLVSMGDPTESIAAFAIYARVALFMFNPIIAVAVAALPYMARRFGESDRAGVARGLRDIGIATTIYSLVFTGPVMLLSARWIAGALAEADLTARYAEFGLMLVPLTCLLGAPFLLCRPVFEAMQRGKPGLVMGILRYAVLTFPAGWLGIRAAEALGWPGLYGLVVALHVVAAVSSLVFMAWLQAALRHEHGAAADTAGRPGLDAPSVS